MLCELCGSEDNVGENNDGVWIAVVCERCHERGWRTLMMQRWLSVVVAETGGECVTWFTKNQRYRYSRDQWAVEFNFAAITRQVLEAKNESALYAELYRWHRDPEKAFPPETRQWIREAIDAAPGFSFVGFTRHEGDQVGVVFAFDGSEFCEPIGVEDEIALEHRDAAAFALLFVRAIRDEEEDPKTL